jgi:hypothetical protein
MIRTPNIKVELIRWDFVLGRPRDMNPTDITQAVLAYQFQKTIKMPMGGCVLQVYPEGGGLFFIDDVSPMDIIKVYEFGVCKFIGYIRTIQFSIEIMDNGKPRRISVLTTTHFGGMLMEQSFGANLVCIRAMDNQKMAFRGYEGAASTLVTKIGNARQEGLTIKELYEVIIDEWKAFMEQLGLLSFPTYIDTWLDYSTGLTRDSADLLPRNFQFFYSEGQDANLFTELKKMTDPPLYELWFDNGGHFVDLGNGPVLLPNDKVCMVLRKTPFDGTIENDATFDRFTGLPTKNIPLDILKKIDVSKSMEEAYSYYMATPAEFELSEFTLWAMGAGTVDEAALQKYLFRPMRTQLFYVDGTSLHVQRDGRSGNIIKRAQNATDTFKTWYENNDKYKSGVLAIMVPSRPEDDVYIGEKIAIEGVNDAWFYVEGISHSWSYGGALISSVTYTRGWGVDGEVQFRNKLFRSNVAGVGAAPNA